MDLPCGFTDDFLADLPYDPSVLLFDRIESIDIEARTIVCRMPTDRPLPFTSEQRVHPVKHPRHVSGGVIVHATGMLGFVHVYHLHGFRHADGWTGYGTNIHKAVFRKLVPPGLPLICRCQEVRHRRMGDKAYATYRFEFRHDGDLAYESEQSAMWIRTGEQGGGPASPRSSGD
jgi:hypothetical protein